MSDIRSRRRVPDAKVGLVVTQFNEAVTTRLLDGALRYLEERDVDGDAIDVVRVAGAFELPVTVAELAASGRYGAVVALGAIVRGETPHFEHICSSVAYALQQVAVVHRVPVGFGVLTTDTMAQALARAGGEHGNKGYEAAEAALDAADVMGQLRRAPS